MWIWVGDREIKAEKELEATTRQLLEAEGACFGEALGSSGAGPMSLGAEQKYHLLLRISG